MYNKGPRTNDALIRNRQAEQEGVERAKAKHASSRTFVEGKQEIEYLYDVGRSLENEFNPNRKHDSFYDFQKVTVYTVFRENSMLRT